MSNLLYYLILVFILVIIILIATYLINIPTNDYEKHSAYECGFEPFGDARSFFDVHFYTIGLLFIIFDLEVVFLIPAIADIASISAKGYLSFIIFLGIVLVGFYYEWAMGLLNGVPNKISEKTLDQTQQNFFSVSLLGLATDSTFVILGAGVLLALSCNFLENLIYRVINLALLSLMVVGTWSYFTDLTFIYIVYILAFVGAVIMLFLSVILMLPSSVILKHPNNEFSQYNVVCGIIALEVAQLQSSYYTYSLLYFVLLAIIVTLGKAVPKTYNGFVNTGKFLRAYLAAPIQAFYAINSGTSFIVFYKALLCDLLYLFGITVEPGIFLTYYNNPSLRLPTFALIGMHWQNFLYYLYLNIEINLYNGVGPEMYRYTYPVGNKTFMIFEQLHAPIRLDGVKYVMPAIKSPYKPLPLRVSMFRLLPFAFNLPFISYIKGSTKILTYINRVLFIGNLIGFFTITGLMNLIISIYTHGIVNFALLKQGLTTLVIMLIAIPTHSNIAGFSGDKTILTPNELDSLIAIKTVLYENNFLYLFLSVMGLLIALIGSAVFTRHSKY